MISAGSSRAKPPLTKLKRGTSENEDCTLAFLRVHWSVERTFAHTTDWIRTSDETVFCATVKLAYAGNRVTTRIYLPKMNA